MSHNMAAIGKLCGRCLILKDGQVLFAGTTNDALSHYLKIGEHSDGVRTWDAAVPNVHDARFKMLAARILTPAGKITGHVDIRHPVTIELEYSILETLSQFRIGLQLSASDGAIAFTTSDSTDPGYETKARAAGAYTTRCVIPGNLLNEGFYSLRVSADIPFQKTLFLEEGALGFFVEQTSEFFTRFPDKWAGAVCPHFEWQTRPVKK
ncbi:MAG TPA: hypothetical protein VGI63_01730 [Verrucomicrobiae bacterium]